jgi:hypothetical protein
VAGVVLVPGGVVVAGDVAVADGAEVVGEVVVAGGVAVTGGAEVVPVRLPALVPLCNSAKMCIISFRQEIRHTLSRAKIPIGRGIARRVLHVELGRAEGCR